MSASMMARVAAAVVAVGLLLFIDLRTKTWAASELRARGPRTVAGVRLQYQENSGIAFGRLRDNQTAIVAYSAVVSLTLIGLLLHRLIKRRAPGFLIPAGFAALLAGTLGNLHDRLERGYVIDFIDVAARRWPTFNVADAAIAAGLALCAVALGQAVMRPGRRRPATA